MEFFHIPLSGKLASSFTSFSLGKGHDEQEVLRADTGMSQGLGGSITPPNSERHQPAKVSTKYL